MIGVHIIAAKKCLQEKVKCARNPDEGILRSEFGISKRVSRGERVEESTAVFTRKFSDFSSVQLQKLLPSKTTNEQRGLFLSIRLNYILAP